MKRTFAVGAVGVVSALFLVALFIPNSFGGATHSGGPAPDGPGNRIEDQGRTHIEIGDSHAAYASIPATSGWHYDAPATWGIKDEPLPPERYVHNWDSPTAGVTSLEDLPKDARAYVDRIQELIGVPIDIISTGPHRDETIVVRDILPS